MSVFSSHAGRAVGILLSAVIAFFAFAGAANASGEYEPNNSRGNPAGPIAPGATIAAELELGEADSDWYVFYVAETTEVSFTVNRTGGPNQEFNSEFVYANGDLVTFQKLASGVNSVELKATVPPGKYFTWVYGNFNGTAGGTTYTVKYNRGLSTFEAIKSGCTTSQGEVTSLTAALKAANAELASAKTRVTKADKSLSKARKAKARTRKAKKAKARSIARAKKSVSTARKSVSAAQAKVTSDQTALDQAKADSEKLCGIE